MLGRGGGGLSVSTSVVSWSVRTLKRLASGGDGRSGSGGRESTERNRRVGVGFLELPFFSSGSDGDLPMVRAIRGDPVLNLNGLSCGELGVRCGIHDSTFATQHSRLGNDVQ